MNPERISEITAHLNPDAAMPVFFTPPFTDRDFWGKIAASPNLTSLYERADRAASTPPPELSDELYNDMRKTGARSRYEKPYEERTQRLGYLLFAEGLANDGKRLSAIERELAAILDEPSWAVPAHTLDRENWAAAREVVDLAAAARSWDLALTDYLLADKLAPATRTRIRKEIRERVIVPYLERLRSGDHKDFWWMNITNNWNAVCHGGVIGAGLLLAGGSQPAVSRTECAELIAGFETLTQFYLSGFSEDGFCEEGINYWVYGYGHYTMASELIRLATKGYVDLLAGDKQKTIALFDVCWELSPGLYPLFGDSFPGRKPCYYLHDFATLRYAGSGGIVGPTADPIPFYNHSLSTHLYATCFDLSLKRPASGEKTSRPVLPLRDWFPNAGALIVRRSGSEPGLSAAFDGGDNGQSHNHDDIGSFVVAFDGEAILADLGADTYVKDTFSPKRYTSQVINSFGHPVPRVAGRLQREGKEARAVTLRTEFTEAYDVWEIDMTSAYPVAELEKLTRTFRFERAGAGRVEIVDRVKFKSPQSFGTAVILSKDQKREDAGEASFLVRGKKRAVRVEWSSEVDGKKNGSPILIDEKPIIGIVPSEGTHGTRVGLDFSQPVTEAVIRLVLTPAL